MARLTSTIRFSGTLDNISSYTIEGREGVFLRRKGGASREKILHDPCFENTRRNLKEFGGRGPATHLILEALKPLKTGQGVTGDLNHLLSVIQKMDVHSAWGERAVALSVAPELLRGLNISRKLLLDTIAPNLFPATLSRETLYGRVEVPALLPGVNCFHPQKYPFFRVMAILGAVPDLFYNDKWAAFVPVEGYSSIPPQKTCTAWQQTNTSSEAATLELSLPQHPGTGAFSLLLSVALEYGKLGVTGAVEPVNKAVAAKVVAVG